MSAKHHKHPPISRVIKGHYSNMEWAIYGTTCGKIEAFVNDVISKLPTEFQCTYIDADHNVSDPSTTSQIGKKTWTNAKESSWNEYDDKLNTPPNEIVLVNGNHYPAASQIVIIDNEKKDSLYRHIDQLEAVQIVIVDDEANIFECIKEKMLSETIIIHPNEIERVTDFITKKIEISKPNLKAVILSGGKSKRMSMDKSKLVYHDGQSQEIHLAQICEKIGIETYISKDHQFDENKIGNYAVIKDKMVEMGPFGAIISAMMHDPNAAWLVLACDLPLIDKETISRLLQERKAGKFGTAFKLDSQRFPEPLMAIYEPAIYQRMLRFLSLGYACPRKVLINSDIHILPLKDEIKAYNANTPEEREKALEIIKAKK